ncbi:MAG TPA: hypothetical protein VG944_00100 [Fimbriimonas sp.]|nr:hypothetical protein [Fimbriimonas sp.]
MADTTNTSQESNPDPGRDPSAPKPLSPEEYEEAKEEAREAQPTDGHPEKARE